ncbi:MAG TPA: DUF169 domain-containing protein [Candidatus Tectomicrobia bacterium]|nr:DUF169 domain-containing protein [Candidatus Tectomicrobia bacterium]
MPLTSQDTQLQTLLGLTWPPVAVAFQPLAPAGIQRIGAVGPSGCTYWKLAAEGKVFYTEAADHYNCPIGSFTHGIDLPPAQAQELEGLVGTMIGLEYIRQEEIPTIPRRHTPFGVAIYAPLAASPFAADVVLVCGNAKQLMLIAEAANAAGLSGVGGLMGRPTCAMIPAAIQDGHVTTSLGCIGNRVYTGLEDDEFYAAIPGPRLALLVDKLVTIVSANRELESFHRTRMGRRPSV